MFDRAVGIDEVQHMLENMAFWHIEYLKLKEFKRTAEARRSI